MPRTVLTDETEQEKPPQRSASVVQEMGRKRPGLCYDTHCAVPAEVWACVFSHANYGVLRDAVMVCKEWRATAKRFLDEKKCSHNIRRCCGAVVFEPLVLKLARYWVKTSTYKARLSSCSLEERSHAERTLFSESGLLVAVESQNEPFFTDLISRSNMRSVLGNLVAENRQFATAVVRAGSNFVNAALLCSESSREVASGLCEAAARLDDAELVSFFAVQGLVGKQVLARAAFAAAEAGSLACLELLTPYPCSFQVGNSLDILVATSTKSSFPCFKFLCEQQKATPRLMSQGDPCGAANRSDLHCTQQGRGKNTLFPLFICDDAVRGGRLDCLRYAHENGGVWSDYTCFHAACGGSLECLRFAHQRGAAMNGKECEAAAEHGNFECLRYAHEHGCGWGGTLDLCHKPCSARSCVSPTARGSSAKKRSQSRSVPGAENCFRVMRFAHENGCHWTDRTCETILRGGCSGCLSYALEHGVLLARVRNDFFSLVTAAAVGGNARCMQLVSQSLDKSYSREAVLSAYRAACVSVLQRNGDVECLRFALERTWECLPAVQERSELVLKLRKKSSSLGRLSCLKLLYELSTTGHGKAVSPVSHGPEHRVCPLESCQLDHGVVLRAVFNGHIQCAEHARERGEPWFAPVLLYAAARTGNLRTLRYVYESSRPPFERQKAPSDRSTRSQKNAVPSFNENEDRRAFSAVGGADWDFLAKKTAPGVSFVKVVARQPCGCFHSNKKLRKSKNPSAGAMASTLRLCFEPGSGVWKNTTFAAAVESGSEDCVAYLLNAGFRNEFPPRLTVHKPLFGAMSAANQKTRKRELPEPLKRNKAELSLKQAKQLFD